MSIQRNIAPDFKLPEEIRLKEPSTYFLDNKLEVKLFDGGNEDITKLDFIIEKGSSNAKKPLVASFTSNLLTQGTKNKSAFEIAEFLDFHGSYIRQYSGYHNTIITVFSLNKHLNNILSLIKEIITMPVFDENEFKVILQKQKQEYLLNNKKVKNIALNKSQQVLFGKNHPYGRIANINSYDNLKLNDINDFYKNTLSNKNIKILASGKVNEDVVNLLNKYFGNYNYSIEDKYKTFPVSNSDKEKFHLVTQPDAVQSAIRIVKKSIMKTHDDYMGLSVLNTILGGYFGSRLMTNIREQKGLTYGIYSFLLSYKYDGIIGIASEVISDKRQIAIDEIFNEMKKLRENAISQDELNVVKNYMLGDLMRNLDGPFSIADAYKAIMNFDLSIDFYQKLANTIKNISSDDILSLANKYLKQDDFYTIVAGV